MERLCTPPSASLLVFVSAPLATPPLPHRPDHSPPLHRHGLASGSRHVPQDRPRISTAGLDTEPPVPPTLEQSLSGCHIVLSLDGHCRPLTRLGTDLRKPLAAPRNASKTPFLARITRTFPHKPHRVFYFKDEITTPISQTSLDRASISAISQASAPSRILFLPPDMNRPHPLPGCATDALRLGHILYPPGRPLGVQATAPSTASALREGCREQCAPRSFYEPAAELCSRAGVPGSWATDWCRSVVR